VQVKTIEKDGYTALKLGFIETKKEKLNKPELGLFEKTGIAPQKVLKEVRVDTEGYEVGSVVKADIFAAGDKVDVMGTTKGHGFSGVIKRWNQHRLKETHGVGPVHREPGSMGANSSPSRVFKHKNLPGQYGVERVTIQNLEVVKVDVARNVLLIKGAIPGAKGSVVTVSTSVKSK
jgi:large subunit ribosomal protein L3